LAGGLGTRLLPLTREENKHFLPVGQKRMIEYPLDTLVQAEVLDIILVTGGVNPGSFLNLLRNGYSRRIEHLYYTLQEGEDGIAAALYVAKNFISSEEETVVILGDNYFEDGIADAVREWTQQTSFKRSGAHIILKEVEDPSRFGVAEIKNGKIISIEEKPFRPKSNLVITGCYGLDEKVWDYLPLLQKSARGELEITDILNFYLQEGSLTYSIYKGFWSDMGSPATLLEVANRVSTRSS
jgi:glucose-1-phosphate thymidylyltransferase